MENLDFKFKVVKAKTKSIASRPIVTITSSQNHFVLNSVATDMIGVTKGEGITMLQWSTDNDDARFFVVKGDIEADGAVAKLGETGSSLHYNYSGIYGAIYMDEKERSIISIDELLEKGFYNEYTTPKGNTSKRGSKSVDYTLESVGEHEINGLVREVYALTNRRESILTRTTSVNEADAEETIELED